MIYLTYNVLLALVAVVALPLLVMRALFKGQTWEGVGERLGILPHSFKQTSANSIWLHAVSLGEILSCTQLVEKLRVQFGQTPIFVSTSTLTGRQMANERLSSLVDGIFYSPFDLPFALKRVFRSIRPRMVIVVETEIWPNLFWLTRRSGAGLILINARISDRSVSFYSRFRFFFSHVLQNSDLVLTQSALDRERVIAAGALPERVRVGGNLKYDFRPNKKKLPQVVTDFIESFSDATVLVAGSTREGEEKILLKAFLDLPKSQQNTLLVIAPRHPQRFNETASILASSGISFFRRSQLTSEIPKNFRLPGVLLLDTLGELSSFYQLANIVFVGGSLNGWGGHNVLEPALSGKPVVVGPTMQNFRAITDVLIKRQALVQVDSLGALSKAFGDLLRNSTKAMEIGMRGQQVAESQRGATKLVVQESLKIYHRALPLRRPSLFSHLGLQLFASLWHSVVYFRWTAYQKGWLRRRHLNTFTLCVGNITAGGVGKTPIVLWLIEKLSARSLSVGGLTRGYRRLSNKKNIVRSGSNISSHHTGDETALLFRHLQKINLDIPFGIGSDRHSVGQELETTHTVDILVLDDGFQHLKLERDLDLVLIDTLDPFGSGEIIPVGRLREPLSALRRADVFLLTRTESQLHYDSLIARLHDLNPSAPVFSAQTQAVTAVNTLSGEVIPLKLLRSKKLLAFCGLGNSESFWRSLELADLTITERIQFRDHHVYSHRDVEYILSEAKRQSVELVITTEKDLVNFGLAAEHTNPTAEDFEHCVAKLFQPLVLCWLQIETIVMKGDQLIDFIEEKCREPLQRSPRHL